MAEKSAPKKRPARQQMLEALADTERAVTERRESAARPGATPHGRVGGAMVEEIPVESRVYVDGKKGPLFKSVGNFQFNPDGSRLAYCAGTLGAWQIIIDDKAGPVYENCAYVTFSPDGKHFAYCGEKKGKWIAVLDGQEIPDFEVLTTQVFSIVPSYQFVAFDDDDKLHFIGEKNADMFRVSCTPATTK